MAQKMDQGRLLKIGHEAFALLDEQDGRRKSRPNSSSSARQPSAGVSRQAAASAHNCLYQYQPHKPLVYQVKPSSSTELVIMNSYDAMMKHDGVLVLDYSKKKSTAMAY